MEGRAEIDESLVEVGDRTTFSPYTFNKLQNTLPVSPAWAVSCGVAAFRSLEN